MQVDYSAIYREDATAVEQAKAFQSMVNSGAVWSMEGSMGRGTMDMLESGFLMLGTERTRDYYGNTIPSRFDVEEGSKGSRQNVVDARGEEWAKMLEGVD